MPPTARFSAHGPVVVTELERRGFQSHIHAIGDHAVRVAVDAFQAARRQNPGFGRTRRSRTPRSPIPPTTGASPPSTIGVKPYLGARFDLYEPPCLREGDWGPGYPEFSGKLNALPGLSLREGIRAVTLNGAYQMH